MTLRVVLAFIVCALPCIGGLEALRLRSEVKKEEEVLAEGSQQADVDISQQADMTVSHQAEPSDSETQVTTPQNTEAVSQDIDVNTTAQLTEVEVSQSSENASTGMLQTPGDPTVWYMPQIVQILQGLSFAALVKVLCVAGNVWVQVSPFPLMKSWGKLGHTGEADAAPFVTIAFNGSQWTYYGIFAWYITQRSAFLVLVQSNIIGSVLGTYYTVMFCRYCRNEAAFQQLKLYFSAVAMLVLFEGSAFAVLPSERALFITGLISSFCGFIGALSMLVTLPTVIKMQDARSIPGAYVLANFVSSLSWCACGWLLNDPLVMAPNVVSGISGAVCVYLKIIYTAVPTVDDKECQVIQKSSCLRSSFNPEWLKARFQRQHKTS